jgi:[acyl-carrier-protein] S-malonyltransferase
MTCFLFPGQGSQGPGMGQDLYNESAAAKSVLDEAATLNPEGFLDTLFTGAPHDLNHTQLAQPALLAASVAAAKHLESLDILPTLCTGHSLGEISALVVAGVCSFSDAMTFTRERARLMSENIPEGGMAAVMGLAPDAIEAALPEGVQLANLNGPSQTIISGTKAGIEASVTVLKDAGAKRVMPLKVSGPFHSFLMEDASQEMRQVLESVSFSAPRTRFISSVSAREESDPAEIKTLLWKQLVSPVRWTEVMAVVGEVTALEVGPGRVLQGLAKRMDGAATVHSAGKIEAIAALTSAETD